MNFLIENTVSKYTNVVINIVNVTEILTVPYLH